MVVGSSLINGNTKSCGCLKYEKAHNLKDLMGIRFNRLLVTERDINDRYGQAQWKCLCDCGTKIIVKGSYLRTGDTQSCGCLHRERASETNTKHGHRRRNSTSAEYRAYRGAKDRCLNPKNPGYLNYGGRGIEFKYKSFIQFLADVGPCPGPGYSIDRIDNNGHYEPGNCKWSTRAEQNRNKRNNVKIIYKNKEMVHEDWAKELQIHSSTLTNRIKRAKWSIKKAFTTPVRKSNSKKLSTANNTSKEKLRK